MRKTIPQEHQSYSVKKPLEKQQIFENCELFKNQESKERLRPMRRLLPLQNGEFGSKIKNAKKKKKTCKKRFYKNTRVVLCKKRSRKHQIFKN